MSNRWADWLEQAEHVPTRYPNGHPDGAPFEHYGPLQSDQALDHARTILEFIRTEVA